MGDFLYAIINMLSGSGIPDFYYRKRCNSAWSGLSVSYTHLILEKVIGIVEELKDEADTGVCISTAGMVDIEKGEIFYSAPLIPNYKMCIRDSTTTSGFTT